MGSDKSGYKSPNMGHKYSYSTLLVTLLISTHEPPSRVPFEASEIRSLMGRVEHPLVARRLEVLPGWVRLGSRFSDPRRGMKVLGVLGIGGLGYRGLGLGV